MKGTERSLKSQNFAWHVALSTADVVVLRLRCAGSDRECHDYTARALPRARSCGKLPIVVLLLMNVLSSNFKAMLSNGSPMLAPQAASCFTKYGPADYRIDMVQLKKNVGAWVNRTRKWYKLYKQVETVPEVAYAQKDFLMYCDMAALPPLLMVLAPLGLYVAEAGTKALWAAAGLFFMQYVLTAIVLVKRCERFVCKCAGSARRQEGHQRKGARCCEGYFFRSFCGCLTALTVECTGDHRVLPQLARLGCLPMYAPAAGASTGACAEGPKVCSAAVRSGRRTSRSGSGPAGQVVAITRSGAIRICGHVGAITQRTSLCLHALHWSAGRASTTDDSGSANQAASHRRCRSPDAGRRRGRTDA